MLARHVCVGVQHAVLVGGDETVQRVANLLSKAWESNPVFTSHHNEGEAVIGEEGSEGDPQPVLNAVVAPRLLRLR